MEYISNGRNIQRMHKFIDMRNRPELLPQDCIWIVLSDSPQGGGKRGKPYKWYCQCSGCGVKRWIVGLNLRSGRTLGCRRCWGKRMSQRQLIDMRIQPLPPECPWEILDEPPKTIQQQRGKAYLWHARCRIHGVKSWIRIRKDRNSGCYLCGRHLQSLGRQKRPLEWMIAQIRRSKKWEGLTYEELVTITESKTCHYCDEPLIWNALSHKGCGANNRTNLDRKDSSIGYRKDNLVPCCPKCNCGKSNRFTYEQWVEIGQLIKAMREHHPYTFTPA